MTRSIARLLAQAEDREEGRRDVEVLLCHVLGKPRSFLYAYPERELDDGQYRAFQSLCSKRREGTPIAYLTGEREFWSLALSVSEQTLIPRPETERLVELGLELALPATARVLDLGTGSGAIALALARERPHWTVTAVDCSVGALGVARANAAHLGLAHIDFQAGDWFEPLAGERFDLVVSNPPYLDSEDPHLGEGDLRFEPAQALVAPGGALASIEAIITDAPDHLHPGGWLLLEHGMAQGDAVRQRLSARGFVDVATWQDYAGRDRVSGGQWTAGHNATD